LEGVEHMPEFKDDARESIARDVFKIYVKLNSAFRKLQVNHASINMEFELRRSELFILIKWLKLRMTHCEMERDQRVCHSDTELPKFDPDTYIGQKLLLLELLDLAMGTIVG
jgi:hypothetical protein